MIADVIVVTPPAVEPVELDQAIIQARGIVSGDEDLFEAKIKAARERCEQYTRRSLIQQTLDVWLDSWDGVGVVDLPRGKVISVDEVTTYDYDNTDTVADPSIYNLIGESTVLFNDWLPAYRSTRGVRMRIKSGYGPDPEDVPEPLREGILQYATFLYEKRIGEGPEAKYAAQVTDGGLPSTVADLWRSYQIRSA